uniref:G-protein coupled receptors family 1 profile domain-containing protein n=1 Tax=Trichuris muris TaxID=70415 RepID=A0A5S6Q2J1_TRIMR
MQAQQNEENYFVELANDASNSTLVQLLILIFSTIAFFVNCLFLLAIDHEHAPRRMKNIIASYVLASILKAATAASDSGRNVVIGATTGTTSPTKCLFQSPDLIMLVFTSTYAVFAQLIVSLYALVASVWIYTPYSTREKISDNLFIASVFVGILNVIVLVLVTIFKNQHEISSRCFFDAVVPREYAVAHWFMVALVCYSSVLIYFSAFFIMRVNWSSRKRIKNHAVLVALKREVESVQILMPIFLHASVNDVIPISCRILIAVGVWTPVLIEYWWLATCIELCLFPVVYLYISHGGSWILDAIKNFCLKLIKK